MKYFTMRQNTWTNKELEFLKENYPKYGINFCMEKLGYNKSKIQNTTHKLGIKLLPEIKSTLISKSADKCNINPELFYNIKSKEVVYLLGLIWADGFLNQSLNGCNHSLGFTMIKDDIDTIKIILDSIGKWNYYERKQPNQNWKPSINVITNNKRIFNFLVEHDYNKKSYVSADKILSKIPENLKYYFFLGLIDGDGCFYHYVPDKGSTLRQFVLASTYEQDWSYFEKLCNELGIIYKIIRTKGKKSSSSCVRITNKDGIKKLGEYIYQKISEDGIGLARKYKKYNLIIK